MVFLFATLPVEDRIRGSQVVECQRLSSEFLAYIVEARCLKKTFLSVKGVYYQAEILGQDITWIVPYRFAQLLPVDVDFKVMGTFLELYIALLTFVNYKLYADQGLCYPPKVDAKSEDQDCGITSYVIERTVASTEAIAKKAKKSKVSKSKQEAIQQRLATLGENMEVIQEDSESDDELNDTAVNMDFQNTVESDDEQTTAIDSLTSFSELKESSTLESNHANLFSNCVFYLSRETPRWSLEFVIRSFGGQVGWEDDSTKNLILENTKPRMGVSQYDIKNSRITHHIIDRPVTADGSWKQNDRREYVQPQWVYDCINQKRILTGAKYAPGEVLPAHLSPFVKYEEGDYKPEGVDEIIQEAEEVIPFIFIINKKMAVVDSDDEDVEVVKKRTESELVSEKERALFMMSKKDRRLYQQIEFGKKKKEVTVDLLKSKKERLDSQK